MNCEYCRPATVNYWLGLTVASEDDCLNQTYTWVDGSVFNYTSWQAGLSTWPSPSFSAPLMGPYGCVYALDTVWDIAPCDSTMAVICQRGEICIFSVDNCCFYTASQ